MVKMEGVVEIVGANAVWMDPVAILNSSYSDYKVSHSRYYSRSSFVKRNCSGEITANEIVVKGSRKRKRKKAAYEPNEKELLAELRHQEARSAILDAHSSFLATTYAEISSTKSNDSCAVEPCNEATLGLAPPTNGTKDNDLDFRQLAEVWQAPLYELSVLNASSKLLTEASDRLHEGVNERVLSTHQLFNSFIENEDKEAIAECAGALFVLPRQCRFLISDVSQVHQLIPDRNQGISNPGYNIVVIDPPWENKSVRRHSLYPMMPNKQLFSLPVKQLAHNEGALVALWLTNREKLHQFVEKELFPSWGVKLAATWYWLKLNGSGQMISPLDLQHHKPYECLLLGYLFNDEVSSIGTAQEAVAREESGTSLLPPEKFVLMSIPGDHSRKPPIGTTPVVSSGYFLHHFNEGLLAQYAPGARPVRGVELFARELNTGWTSWGNEPLHFQNLKHFQQRV